MATVILVTKLCCLLYVDDFLRMLVPVGIDKKNGHQHLKVSSIHSVPNIRLQNPSPTSIWRIDVMTWISKKNGINNENF